VNGRRSNNLERDTPFNPCFSLLFIHLSAKFLAFFVCLWTDRIAIGLTELVFSGRTILVVWSRYSSFGVESRADSGIGESDGRRGDQAAV
jgi:hypothetical protein